MKIAPPYREYIIHIVCYLYILLFVYAAVSKLLDFKNFQAQLGQSPLLSAYTGWVSFAVIIAEIFIAILLSVKRFNILGLLFAFALMALFTTYIIVITNYSYYVPCSCGGILQNMEWKDHLIFNICFLAFAVTGILLHLKVDNKYLFYNRSWYPNTIFSTLSLLTGINVLCAVFIIQLYYLSEDKMHTENPFIRRFIEGIATKTNERDIKSNSLYFAGSVGNKIYLGDNIAPLHLLEYDALLHQTRHIKLKISEENFSFRSVHVRICAPFFYVSDGTVPVIFKGSISNWQANIIKNKNISFFSKAEIIDSTTIVYRARDKKTYDNVIGKIDLQADNFGILKPGLLEKQIDGFFDTDGTMHFDIHSKKFVYTYFYRNQFIVCDSKLSILYRGKTIDTTSHAKIKVAFIKNTGERKLASTPEVVNNLTAIFDNSLFINSNLRGRFETGDMWKNASIVDIYDLNQGNYRSSLYIYKVEGAKVSDFIINGSDLYAIVGHYLQHYKLNMAPVYGKKLPAGNRGKIENLH